MLRLGGRRHHHRSATAGAPRQQHCSTSCHRRGSVAAERCVERCDEHRVRSSVRPSVRREAWSRWVAAGSVERGRRRRAAADADGRAKRRTGGSAGSVADACATTKHVAAGSRQPAGVRAGQTNRLHSTTIELARGGRSRRWCGRGGGVRAGGSDQLWWHPGRESATVATRKVPRKPRWDRRRCRRRHRGPLLRVGHLVPRGRRILGRRGGRGGLRRRAPCPRCRIRRRTQRLARHRKSGGRCSEQPSLCL